MSTTARLAQLLSGLVLFGASIALMVRANLGLDPWDVLHQGLARRTGISIGLIVIVVSALVLALWVPLHQRPGVGTLANVALVGLSLEATLTVLPAMTSSTGRGLLLIAGIVGNAAATSLYLGAGMGPGPRDGLMTGLANRGISIRVARTGIEVTALVLGWLLGGSVGLGTIAYALTIGSLTQLFIPLGLIHRPCEGIA